MDLQQFQQLLLQKQKEIEQAMRRTLPVKVGRIAKDHFQDNFRQGGFQDNGTQAWQRKKRPDKYGPLMSSRQNLYGSIYYRPDEYRVTVGTEVPYAAIHNEGGQIIVTQRMKRFFRAKAYEAAGTFGLLSPCKTLCPTPMAYIFRRRHGCYRPAKRSARHPQTLCLTSSNSVFDNLKHTL